MSKEKLEKDFQEFGQQIDKLAEDEIKTIRERTGNMKAEVAKVGESLAASVSESGEH